MIDIHTHTFLSDGLLCPAEHIRHAEMAGYRVLGIADHADLSTMADIIRILKVAAARENELGRLRVLAGVEFTHVRPEHLEEAAATARNLGADIVLCHGETIAEPVIEGTNRAAILAGVDYLAHPGLITQADAELAAEKGVYLEISGKAGHSLANGHVAKMALKTGAKLMFGSDSHSPEQFFRQEKAKRVLLAAGLDETQAEQVFANAEEMVKKLLR